MKNINSLIADSKCSIKDVMRVIDVGGLGIALIVDSRNKLVGTTTDGDIRRAILKGVDIKEKIAEIMNPHPIYVRENFDKNEIKSKIGNRGIGFHLYTLKVPVVDENMKLKNIAIYSKENDAFLLDQQKEVAKSLNKILVVGGAGYLGTVQCKKLLRKGYKVRVLDKLIFGLKPIADLLKDKNFEIIQGDMRNISMITQSTKDVDAIILLAGIVGDPASKHIPLDTIETNYIATNAIAQASKYQQINRFIFASTCSVYGASKGILDEESPLNPVSLYARSKIDSEKTILNMVDGNFSPTIMRMGTLYGLSPRMRLDLVVNTFALKSLIEKKIQIFGGDQWRPMLNVEDASDAFIKCLEAPIDKVKGKIFNVGSERQNYTINRIGEIVKELYPDTVIERLDNEIVEGAMDKRDYKVSFKKIEDVIGFNAKKSIKESLKEIRAFICNGNFEDALKPECYNIKMAERSKNV